MSVLEVRLDHRLGPFRLEVELALGREIGVLFGPSGAGKSLVLRLIAGLERPRQGRVALAGRVLTQTPGGPFLAPRLRRIGLVPQQLALFPHLTVLQNVAYGLRGSGRLEQARGWMECMRLKGLEERFPAQLSGGQRQRVALARALAPGPELLLLDEPFSALDGPLRRSLRRELKRLQRQAEIPVLYVTHQIEDVSALGSRVFLMIEGRLAGRLSPEELWRSAFQAEAWSVLGWGNLVRGEVSRRSGQTFLLWPGGRLELAEESARPGPAAAFVAPQDVKLLYPDLPVDPQLAANVMEGRVLEHLPVGHAHTLYVEACGLQWHIEFATHSYRGLQLEEGSAVRIAVRPAAVSVLAPAGQEGR